MPLDVRPPVRQGVHVLDGAGPVHTGGKTRLPGPETRAHGRGAPKHGRQAGPRLGPGGTAGRPGARRQAPGRRTDPSRFSITAMRETTLDLYLAPGRESS